MTKKISFIHDDFFLGVVARKELPIFLKPEIDLSNVILISILDPEDESNNNKPLSHRVRVRFRDTLTVKFWDIEKQIENFNPISEVDACRIFEFISKYKDQLGNTLKLLVHCNAGISRSAGVAMAARCIATFNCDKFAFMTSRCKIKMYRRYSPNLYVFDKICKCCKGGIKK